MKRFRNYLFFCIIAILIFLVCRNVDSGIKFDEGQIIINGQTIKLNIADVYSKQAKGLSGQSSLTDNQGMLFVYQQLDNHAIWMKQMNFPIDIIWIDQQKIVDLMTNVPAPKVGDSTLPIYQPRADNKCFLEVNAGLVAKYHWQIGDSVVITPDFCR
ncbi:MAG: DUF192 domain-containing protein [Candidatus Aenigmarchaeota archaeon]|nr:DUF192 domain-containing protein [Candidatus Aenigmarchaeota archaeon]